MGIKERKLTKERCLEINPNTERLFRINAGDGWQGKIIRGWAKILKCVHAMGHNNRAILIINPRPLSAAPAGWADLSGWETIKITPEMVGQEIAQFKMIEVKATGSLSPEQKIMQNLVLRMGGKFEVLEKID